MLEVFSFRFWSFGHSKAIITPKEVRDRLGLVKGDLLLGSMYGPLLILRKVRKRDVVDMDSIPADAIPRDPVSQVRDAS